MNLLSQHKQAISAAFSQLFGHSTLEDIPIVDGKTEFTCDFTIVLFPYVKKWGKSPELIGKELGEYLLQQKEIISYTLIKGFFNYNLPQRFWTSFAKELFEMPISERVKSTEKPLKVVIEYCSPNTNKPLHLGHVRNILLGWSLKRILEARGHAIHTTQVINDRGIAICKSMLAWKLFGDNTKPRDVNIKGDHFVGDYYVLFEQKFKEEYENWQTTEQGSAKLKSLAIDGINISEAAKKYKNDYFNNESILGKQAKEMLQQWESGGSEVRKLWEQMNAWVYEGFQQTFDLLGVSFDSNYYESNTYLLGKDIVEDGLQKSVFYQLEDGSTWIDLEDVGLDKKVVRRKDGTSVYITQDLGTAVQRHEHQQADRYIYIVADEQDYHFKVLFATLKKLQYPFAESLFHLNYGMMELPTGKMKSREGTVVDADDLIQEVVDEARHSAEERGEIVVLSQEEREEVFKRIGMSALKYFILKVQAKKKMIFDPKESVDMQGNTGPYIVNAYVRIKSLLRKGGKMSSGVSEDLEITQSESAIIRMIMNYPNILLEVEQNLDPAPLANYLYALAKDYHKYYHDYRILNAETEQLKQWRLLVSMLVMNYLEHGMLCLGISMPERM